ncbi:MAG: hemerythrin domain-containing protein [Solirubrobacterales bacterium]
MKATQQLKDEHRAVTLMLEILEKALIRAEEGMVDLTDLQEIIGFLKGFVDKCHHGKEEDLLFPVLKERGIPETGGPIGQMLFEHQQGRSHIQAMVGAVESLKPGSNADDAIRRFSDAGREYIGLLTSHIEKENQILFRLADSVLDETAQDALYEQFETLEEERIGIGQHEKYHELLKHLAAKYLQDHSGQHHNG